MRGVGIFPAPLWAVLLLVHLASCTPIAGRVGVVDFQVTDQRHAHVLSNNAPQAHLPMIASIPTVAAESGARYGPSSMAVVDSSEPIRHFTFPQAHSFQSTHTPQSSPSDSNSNLLDLYLSSIPVAKELPKFSGPSRVSSIKFTRLPGPIALDNDRNIRTSSFRGGYLLNNLFNLQGRAIHIALDKFLWKRKPPARSTQEGKRSARPFFGAVSESPSAPAVVKARFDSSLTPQAAWRRDIDSDATANPSPSATIASPSRVSEKRAEDVMFRIFGIMNPTLSGILGGVKSFAKQKWEATMDSLEEWRLMDDIIWGK